MGPYNLGRQRQPTLKLVADLLQQASLDLESALEEKALLLARVCSQLICIYRKCTGFLFSFLPFLKIISNGVLSFIIYSL
jgi:hypothetical protein